MPRLANYFTRALWLKVHLYIALWGGFFFALIGLTGSLNVYRAELDTLLNPKLVIENPQGQYQSLDKIVAAVKAAHPDRHGSWTLEMPQSPNEMLTAWFEKPQETYFDYYAPLMVSVNPYTAEVVDSRFWGSTAMTWLLDVHTQLKLDQFGWQAVGVLGGLMMLSICTGLYLWWPAAGGFRQAFALRVNQGMMRLLMDLHRWLGLLSAGALLVLAFTGLQLSYPQILEGLTGAQDMGHGNNGRPVLSTARPNNRPVPLEAAEFMARGPFPRATLRRVTTPVGENGTYRINLRQSGEANQKHPFTMVWIDRWSGQIKSVRDPGLFSSGERLMTWMWPLHTGEALGEMGRFAWFIAGLCPAYFYVSGLLHWLHKRGVVRDRPVRWDWLKTGALELTDKCHNLTLASLPHLQTLLKRALQLSRLWGERLVDWLEKRQ
ncbi:MAG: PepSY-associated TM helix domain-containing protein [Methylovulum sp.]|uniref:PepSY-associated TM helix domain-containing protein n=1 Tax=Methylovulum sp. TaxID=1916980 RepID=UPI0026023158|nr:PepSY-associated TM helix domain-containing protein [Methylovulum sp.]MDD2723111.1 PepSY-associated TM helix domain-containing protein [Methylovulum sp.]MDD5123577.1 PepSY-associated TM helix domain-containing protein [Methylovulum sp.]